MVDLVTVEQTDGIDLVKTLARDAGGGFAAASYSGAA
jgi:hypothetical protein